MKVKTYEVLTRAIEEGIDYGHMRAYKHNDTPTVADINNSIYDGVMSSLNEVFDFTDEGVYDGK